MDDSFFVSRSKAARNLLRIVDGFARRKRAVAQAIAQRLAFEEFRDDIRCSVCLADVVDRKNVGMIQRGCCAGFLRKALETFGVGGVRRGENLDGDIAVQARVAGAVDFAHAAGTERRLDFVGAEFGASGERHGWAIISMGCGREAAWVRSADSRGGCAHTGKESGFGGQILADALDGVALGVVQGEKFEAVAKALAIADDGANLDGIWRQWQRDFKRDDLSGFEAAGESGADAVLSHFSGAAPTGAELAILKHFDLQANVDGEAGKA